MDPNVILIHFVYIDYKQTTDCPHSMRRRNLAKGVLLLQVFIHNVEGMAFWQIF